MTYALNYLRGDATRPVGGGLKVIAHVCNDVGAWGAGFVLALSKRWPDPERMYRHTPQHLGFVSYAWCASDIIVANMIAQHELSGGTYDAIDYSALERCLSEVARYARAQHASVHMPRIGCGLAGGRWEKIGPIVESCFSPDVPVFVYDLE